LTAKQKRSSEKAAQILATARELFWKHGIRRVTVEEIARTAGVSKVTLYKHFANKVGLTKAVFDALFAEGFARFQEIEAMEAPFAEKVERVIQMKLEQTRDVNQEFIKDVWQNSNPEIQRHIERRLQEGMTRVRAFYAAAQARGEIRRDIELDFILYVSDQLRAMAADEKLVRLYATPQEMVGELVRFFFYGIMPRK
jgi:AcrR family transcriptional regulator